VICSMHIAFMCGGCRCRIGADGFSQTSTRRCCSSTRGLLC
jgi:hypothetical protein